MRLIDADALIQMLRHDIDCYDTGKPDDKLYINAKDVENMIAGQPTAYDVDKVVEQLEEHRDLRYREDGSLMSERTTINIDKAIEIVKAKKTE